MASEVEFQFGVQNSFPYSVVTEITMDLPPRCPVPRKSSCLATMTLLERAGMSDFSLTIPSNPSAVTSSWRTIPRRFAECSGFVLQVDNKFAQAVPDAASWMLGIRGRAIIESILKIDKIALASGSPSPVVWTCNGRFGAETHAQITVSGSDPCWMCGQTRQEKLESAGILTYMQPDREIGGIYRETIVTPSDVANGAVVATKNGYVSSEVLEREMAARFIPDPEPEFVQPEEKPGKRRIIL